MAFDHDQIYIWASMGCSPGAPRLNTPAQQLYQLKVVK